MRIVLINPFDRTVAAVAMPNEVRQFREHLGERSISVGRLPNGDQLLVGRDVRSRHRFSLGGTEPQNGYGIIVGALREGYYQNAASRSDDVERLVRFSEIPDYEVESTPAVLGEDVDNLVALLGSETPVYIDVVPLEGAEHGWCWQNVGKIVRSQGGRIMFGWTIWQRPRLFLTAEFHAVWQTSSGHLIDVTPKPDGEETIAFSAEPRCPVGFPFERRPDNRRLRTYHATRVDIAAALEELGPTGRADLRKRATKRGITVEQAIMEKHADPLAAAIDAMFDTCREIEDITQVYPDGLFCKHPEKLAALELQKLRQHNRMMELARKRFAQASELSDGEARRPLP